MNLEFAANHSGAMLAVTVPLDVARRIAIAGGEKPEDLHITLFYFYENADLPEEQRANIVRLASAAARQYTNLNIKLRGTAVFEENEERPLFALVESPTLVDYRRKMGVALDLAGITYSKEHEFQPHLTLKYLNAEPRPALELNQDFAVNHLDAWFAGDRVPIAFGNKPHIPFQRRRHSFVRPKAGQKQRPGGGSWEEATNRHQRKLVQVFDKWSADLKRDIRKLADRGATIPELSSRLDAAIPKLEKRLSEIQSAGVMSAVKTSAKSRADLPAVRAIAERQVAENLALVKENLVPRIHEKLTLALATGAFFGTVAMNQAFNDVRSMPASYSGGYWVAIFEVQKGLGKIREDEMTAQGLAPEPIRWVLDPMADHCQPSTGFFGCPDMAGEYPGGWNTLRTVPAGAVTCRGNCRCHIEVYREGAWRRGVYAD